MLVFCSCVYLEWDNYHELKASRHANNKNYLMKEVNLDNQKTIAKQLNSKK